MSRVGWPRLYLSHVVLDLSPLSLAVDSLTHVSVVHGRCGAHHGISDRILLKSPDLQSRLIAQMQAVVTQVIFDHALRMRVKPAFADHADTKSVSRGVSEGAAPSQSDSAEDSEDNGVTGTDGGRTESAEDTGQDKPTASGDNMLGKINNLVTTDVNTFELANGLLLACMRFMLE